MKQKIGQFFLSIAVIAWGFWLGGLLYEMVVIIPLWSANLPQSVIEWNSRPDFVMNPTGFYLPTVLTLIFASLTAMVLNWKSNSQKIWLILSPVCVITAFVFTLIYFFPKNDVLFRNQIAGLSGEDITAIAKSWINGNYLRVVIMLIGFFSALKAFGSKN